MNPALILCAVSLCSDTLSGSSACAHASDFTLQVETLEALEGGPLVIKVVLKYQGPGTVEIDHNPRGTDAHVRPAAGWTKRPERSHYFGPAVASLELKSGDARTEILHLHRDYAGITCGKITVQVDWTVRAPGSDGINPGAVIARLSAPLEIEAPEATPERLEALRRRMQEQLARPDLPDEERRDLGWDIVCTRHCALAPVAWHMIEAPHKLDWTDELIQFVSECPEQYPDLDARLAKMAANPDWAGTPDAFYFWHGRKQELPPAAWKTLTEAASVWTRALSYVTFPGRCEKQWKAALLEDLRDQSKPIPSEQFDRLLADLDSDDFDVRESASDRLARLGERVEGQLRGAADLPLSAEARRRVVAALARVGKAKQPPECLRALDYLTVSGAAENGEILQVLADGRPDAWLTQQAKEELAQWRKHHGPPDK